MDLSRLSDADLQAIADGDMSRVSTDGLRVISGEQAESKPSGKPPSAIDIFKQDMRNIIGGAVRGAGSIGATLVEAARTGSPALGGQDVGTFMDRRGERVASMDAALREGGSDPEAVGFQVPKVGAEIAGTMGIGNVLAQALSRAPMLATVPGFMDAVRTAGFSAGGASGVGGAATRAAGGALVGGSAAGLVDPESAGTGVVIGAALPGVVQAAGSAGRAVRDVFQGPEKQAARKLANALEVRGADIPVVAAKLRAAQELVAGSQPTVGQVLRTPQAGILERVVSDSPGGSLLKSQYQAQNLARLNALDDVARIDPRGFASIQDEFGLRALSETQRGNTAAKAATSALYDEVPKGETAFYLPSLDDIVGKMYPRGTVKTPESVTSIARMARELSGDAVESVTAAKGGQQGKSLAQAVRSAGGLSLSDNSGLAGELRGLRGDLKNLVRTNGGVSPARMAEKMREAGYLQGDDATELLNRLRDEATGSNVGSIYDDASRAWQAASERAMGDAPGAQIVPRKATLGEFEALRRSINDALDEATTNTEKSTLRQMKQALDDRIDEVVRGDGAPDEVLPLAWADKLSAARAAKRSQAETFETGPQAFAFRRGTDNMPAVGAREFAQRITSSPEDIKQFRKIMDSKPDLFKQFKSMMTTEGASTQTQGGNLTGKFVRWVENTLPKLKASFSASEVKTLERIAADIKRSEAAAAAGMSRGSNTYQNAANALNLGLIDSPLVNAVATRIPIIGSFTGPALQGLRDTARTAQARELAGLLANPQQASEALSLLGRPSMFVPPELTMGLLRAAPVIQADR